MNKEEYWTLKSPKSTSEYKRSHNLLCEWKMNNNIAEQCVIHHRDDTEEVRAYNEAHYERWGFNEDGTFEYGKYVKFMTVAEHIAYHKTGEKRPGEKSGFYGKHHTEETLQKMSEAHKGRIFSEEHKQKISETHKGEKNPLFGKNHSDEAKAKIKAKMIDVMSKICALYKQYKNDGGELTWKDFRKHIVKNSETDAYSFVENINK